MQDKGPPVGNAAEQPGQGAGQGRWVWRQRWQEPETRQVEPARLGPVWLRARGPLFAKGASRIPRDQGGAGLNPFHIDSEGLAKATLAALQKKNK